jgi:hypothetical protein
MPLELGPCQVLFGTDGAEEDLGKTEGGVVITFATDVVDLLSDQYGTSPEDQVISGHKATITCPLAEISLDNLALALNQSVKELGDDSGIAGSNLVGTKLSGKANSLLLKKYVDGSVSADTQDWIRFGKAAPQANFDYSFTKDGQRIINTVFTAFFDDDGYLYYIGDETAATTGS